MILLLVLLVMGIGWVLSAWSTMILVGMIHHDILHAVIPISYMTSLKFAAVFVLFAGFGGILKGVIDQNAQ